MAEEAKGQRRSAKGRFTRKLNALKKAINENKDGELIDRSFSDLNDAWKDVELKHDTYVLFLTDDEIAENDEWIANLQDSFNDALEMYVKDREAKRQTAINDKNEIDRKESVIRNQQELQKIIDQTLVKRTLAEAVFKEEISDANRLLESHDPFRVTPPSALRKIQQSLESAWLDCKAANDKCLELLSREEATSQINWILEIQRQFNRVINAVESEIAKQERERKSSSSNIRLEKIKMPFFNGNMKDYPRFRKDFEVQVMPNLNEKTASYTLRSCLGKEPATLLRGIDDDLKEMWKRLDERYGDPARIADLIIDSVRRFKFLKEGEDKRFVEFVDLVESGHRDLKRLGLEREITTTSSVSIIEKKLPSIIKREWAKIVSSDDSVVDKADKFPSLLKFLLNQKRAIEYDSADLRSYSQVQLKVAVNHAQGVSEESFNSDKPLPKIKKCLFHEDKNHFTAECNFYLSKSPKERKLLLKEKSACWSCLKVGHRQRECKRRSTCGENGCTMTHHRSIHDEVPVAVSAFTSACNTNETCLLQLQRIKTKKGWANVMWDNASSLCFITNDKAKAEKLQGKRAELSIVKVGGQSQTINTKKYQLPLIDLDGHVVQLEVYGIDKITSEIPTVSTDELVRQFEDVKPEEVKRPTGFVDVLIGYEYAGFHPQTEQRSGHLLLLGNRFGKCIGGSHKLISETTYAPRNARVHYVSAIKIDDFFKTENLGIECTPRCGNCKCGKCPIGAKEYTLKEERELELIEKNLEFDSEENRWVATYPWVRDPADLPDNKIAALGMLSSTEKRLAKNPQHARVYDEQIQDMVNRNVARMCTKEELNSYTGPVHYISHHEVLKPGSKSTPVRIVFNSSANYMGHVLNEYWAKGPNLLNSLVGVLIRFRENECGFMGDIMKMYHSVKIKPLDQHTHRFLWREMDRTREADTFVMQRVSFGDKPSGTIATVALRKTAEMSQADHPKAANTVKDNSYMDDIIDSVNTEEEVQNITQEIDDLLLRGGFKMKSWITSGHPATPDEKEMPCEANMATERVLGIRWRPAEDQFCFKVRLNLSEKRRKVRVQPDIEYDQIPEKIPERLTKRNILSQINSIYDPLGLAAPLVVRAKIMLRKLWAFEEKLDWDDAIPDHFRNEWIKFFLDLFGMNHVTYPRCLRPQGAKGDPILIIFSDGSESAYGACAYARWNLANGEFESRLIISKNRLAPLKKMSIDRIELCAAVLSKRLKKLLSKESRFVFRKCYHLVDSQIVHAMIQKETYGFNTFAATRLGEIQEETDPKDWYWIPSEYNIADYLTRGKTPEEIKTNTPWQRGPDFIRLPESKWPISSKCTIQELPQRVQVTFTTECKTKNSLANRIDIHRYSSYNKLIRVTGRVLALYNKNPVSFRNATRILTPDDIRKAEEFWIKDAQKSLIAEVRNGKFKRLCPRVRDDGIIVVGGRTERWIEMSYNQGEVPLLPYNHRFSRIYTEHVHNRGHHGVSTTSAKVRSRFWVVGLHKISKSIRYNCVTCKKLDKKLSTQVMGRLPLERLKPAPPWSSTGLDLFGPYKIRDEVKKRCFGKAYGVIFNCLATRAVHLDLAPDYSTEKFLLVLRRFTSIRGYPAKLISDNGPQLVAANEELKKMVQGWNWEELKQFGVTQGLQWEFVTAYAPWQNGTSEALIRSVKRAISAAIGESIMTFAELQTVFFEIANLINERPLGRHPTSPEDGSYLSPNDLLLGRSTSRVPSGPFRKTSNPNHRFEFVQQIVDAFWKKWSRDFFPSLLVEQKWHTSQRNVRIGDIVLLQDSNQVRGNWKLGKVSEIFMGIDGKVRNVEVRYKNPSPGEAVNEYKGNGYVTARRPVQRLVVLMPVD